MSNLILGNGPSLVTIDWDLLANTRLNVIGINRSYLEYPAHDYLFVQDPIIVLELLDGGYSDDDIRDMNIHTTNYFSRRMQIDKRKKRMTDTEFKLLANYLRNRVIHTIRKQAFPAHSPFTVPHVISYFVHNDIRQNDKDIVFYLSGLELTHSSSDNHFWQNKYEELSRLTGTGGSNKRQLLRQYSVFRRLKLKQQQHRFRLVSVTPKSKLNKLYPYKPTTEILGKYIKRKN